jgi:two-component sensor histidine kinase
MKNAPREGDASGPIRLLAENEKLEEICELIDHLPVALYVCDTSGALRHFNERAALLWGWSGIDATAKERSCSVGSLPMQPPSTAPGGVPVDEVLRTGEPVRDYEVVVTRADGNSAVLLASAEPVFGEDGSLAGVVGCLQEVTDRRRVDFHQKVLLDELNHRVKNTLATVQLLAGQTIRKCGLPKDVQDDFEGRLIALSRAHDHLTRERWAPVDLLTVVEKAIEPYCSLMPEAVTVHGEPIKVSAQASLTLAMIFHELASNAAKFGALSSPKGHLAITWSVANGVRAPTLVINWQETGGPPVSEPQRLGFGSRLLQHGIARQFKGSTRLDYDPSGLRCTMEIPLPSTPE